MKPHQRCRQPYTMQSCFVIIISPSLTHKTMLPHCYVNWRRSKESLSIINSGVGFHTHAAAAFTVQCDKHCKISRRLELRTSGYGHHGVADGVRSAGGAGLAAQAGVFKHHYTAKTFGTGQNRPFKWGVRLTRVFVRRGSTVSLRCQSTASMLSNPNRNNEI